MDVRERELYSYVLRSDVENIRVSLAEMTDTFDIDWRNNKEVLLSN